MADLFARERFNAVMRQPFSEHQNVDHPLSLYAATKKANELMAHSSMPISTSPLSNPVSIPDILNET